MDPLAVVSLKLEKSLFENGIDYLGHVIQPNRLGTSTKATNTNFGLQNPSNATELKSFQGLCNVLKRVVPNVVRVDALLNCKIEKHQPFHDGRLNENEFESLEIVQHRSLLSPMI